jgi:hypothetical protein
VAPRARTFIVECYLPGIEEDAVIEASRQARDAAEALRREGAAIDYLGATFMPGDEVVFHAFRASGPAVVEAASRAAGLSFERIVESIGVGAGAVPVRPGDRSGARPSGREPG